MKRILIALLFAASMYAQEPGVEPRGDGWIAWKWGNFLILIGAAIYFTKRFAPNLFLTRTKEIQKDITEAQATKAAAEKRAAEMEARLATLGAEIEKFRAQSKAEMEHEAERIRQETERQIERLTKQAEQEIESAGNLAMRELREYAAKLALDLAEQRIRTRLDQATEAGLIEDFTKGLEQQGSKN